jgi:predicted RNA methylase
MNTTSAQRIPQSVLEVLSRSTAEGDKLRLPPGQLVRTLYTATNKVIELMGGKWDRKSATHVFKGEDVLERLDNALLTGTVHDNVKHYQFFPTPPDVVAMLIEMADLSAGMTVLEPSAGDGAIVKGLLAVTSEVMCHEIQPDKCATLRTLAGDSSVFEGNFLEHSPLELFDRVVMNPPFTRQQDIDHVLHAHKFLKPDGVLVSVMGAGVSFREDKKANAFRDWVSSNKGFFVELPEGSFSASGTCVNTFVCVVPKCTDY